MGLSGLDSALSGLRVAQQQLNVIANNVSNVNTEGYTRKILPQAAVTVGGVNAGVRSSPVIRNVDLNLERDFWTQVSQVNALEVKQKYLDRIQQFHGPPDLEVSIAAEIAQLRDVFASLADSPEDNFLQRSVVDQAGVLANKMNKLSALISEMRNDTQDEIDASINTINGKLVKIAQLNAQIKFNTASGKSIAELSDQRDQLVKEVSQEIDVSFFVRGDGVMVVQTVTGVQLADERAETLYYNRTPLGPSTYYPNPIAPSDNGIFVGNPNTTPVAIDITQSGLNGKIGGLLELRDQILPTQQAMLDELAHKMALRFEEQGLTLFTDESGHVPRDSSALLTGSLDITGVPSLSPGVNDVFTITLNAGGTSPSPRTLTIDLSVAEANYGPPASNALVSEINAQIAALPDAYSSTVASIDINGFLNISSPYDITISGNVANGLGDAGLQTVLGITRGTEYAAPKTNPLTPVPYVGFSAVIRVNQNVINDNRLVQQGTVATDIPVQGGSNEVIRRIVEFVFGDVKFQEAFNPDAATQVDLRAALNGTTMQDWLGIYSQNNVTGTVNLQAGYGSVASLLNAGGDIFDPDANSATNSMRDQFSISFDDPRTGLPAQTYYLDLEVIQATYNGPAFPSAAHQIAEAINNLPMAASALSDGAPPDPAFNVTASVNAYGQLVLHSRANITINADFTTGDDFGGSAEANGAGGPDYGMGDEGLALLGLTAGTYVTTDPYIDVQVGNDPPVRITIEPGDDENTLYDKLNLLGLIDTQGVPGLAVDDDLINADPAVSAGRLILRPGDDPNDPTFGGDLRITGGPFVSEGGVNGTPAGTDILTALFGTDAPIRDVPHEISTGSGSYEAFRRTGLGPNGLLSTGIISSTNLIDYAQKMVNQQSAESISTAAKITDEIAFRDLLQRRLLDESAVNIEEELSNLILVQTAFAAAARVITAIDEEFQELLNAVR